MGSSATISVGRMMARADRHAYAAGRQRVHSDSAFMRSASPTSDSASSTRSRRSVRGRSVNISGGSMFSNAVSTGIRL